jgi:uncharacterized membrane protein
MCTDGDFNVGISSTDALVKLIEEKRASGITLTALGIGIGIGNLNDAMMEKVSNAGNGIYSVITSRTQASRYAETRMLSTFIHVAKDMKIQLEWNPSHVLASVVAPTRGSQRAHGNAKPMTAVASSRTTSASALRRCSSASTAKPNTTTPMLAIEPVPA